MKVAKGDLIASVLLAAFATGLIGLLYDINLNTGYPILAAIGLVSFAVSAFLFQNQRKNQRKWEKNPVTFPNPVGGGILGQYTERPWHNELAELARQHKKKANKARAKRS